MHERLLTESMERMNVCSSTRLYAHFDSRTASELKGWRGLFRHNSSRQDKKRIGGGLCSGPSQRRARGLSGPICES